MKISRGSAAVAGVFILVCAAVAFEWYVHVQSGPVTVRQIVAASPAGSVKPSPSAGPVYYVPKASAAPGAEPTSIPGPSAARATPGSTPVPARPEAAAEATVAPYSVQGNAAVTQPPSVTVTLAPHVVVASPISEPPDAPPRILAMSLSTPVARGGDVVSGTVETSSNVASVEARIAGYSSPMQKISTGKFALSYRVPHLPFFLHKTYMIQVIARNTRGQAVSTAVPITIR